MILRITKDGPHRLFHPLSSESPLIVYIDIKSPYAFVAKDPTIAMAEEVGVEIDWRPLTLNIPSYLGSARLDKKGKVTENKRSPVQWVGVKAAYRDARRYAGLLGYTLRGTEKIWDTRLIHIAMLWARDSGGDVLLRFLDDVYRRFWVRELDVEDMEVVIDTLTRAGAEVAGFEAHALSQGAEDHDRQQEAIFAAGIFGVPSYVVEEELFFGRENLPLVQWILGGRKGPHPDVAYRAFPIEQADTPALDRR